MEESYLKYIEECSNGGVFPGETVGKLCAEIRSLNLQIGELRTQLKGAVFFIHLDKHTGATFGRCPAPVCSSANEVLGDLAEKPVGEKPLYSCKYCGFSGTEEALSKDGHLRHVRQGTSGLCGYPAVVVAEKRIDPPQLYCNKCGYAGPTQYPHYRFRDPDTTEFCTYYAVEIPKT